jgi:hypothetical protein
MPALHRGPFIPLLLTVLAGCRLIDQTTFAPSPSKNPALVKSVPAPAAAQARAEPRIPLITIDQGTPVAEYRGVLHSVVGAAIARDPNVQFDVTMVVPAHGDPLATVAESRSEAAAVMQEMSVDGIPDSNIHLRAATEAHLTRRQIQVYVR